MSQITPKLFIGSEYESRNGNWLKSHGITHIVNCAVELPNSFPRDFKYLRLNLKDIPGQSLTKALNKSFRFIKNAINKDGKVLVHCHAGISRSVSIVIYYLMKTSCLNKFGSAYSFIYTKRPIARPNIGFRKQLIAMETV